MKAWILGLSLSTALIGTAAAEPLVLATGDNNLSLSIYNQNVALVKDIRPANLHSGINEVIFDGVAQKIQSETAIIFGEGIKVREQNYSYNLMSYTNFLTQYIGQEVTAVRTDPEDGEDRYEKALLLGLNGSQPILQTAKGIDAEFPGRIMFDKVPAGMSNKPTLTAKLDVNRAGPKNLNLAYLTDGLNWKTDYVLNIADREKLNLTGWVTITNESGVDYENAKIQLIAGDVNVVRAPRMMARGAMLNAMKSFEMADSMTNGVVEPESLNSYELYTLPVTATLTNHQSKQIALIEKNDVTYKKEFTLHSPLYYHTQQDEFEKQHPSITYVMENTSASNLGISLPAGTARFYQNDKSGNLQFIGSAHIANTSKEDTIRLDLGRAFNISVSGKVEKVSEKEVSRTKRQESSCYDLKLMKTYTASVTVNNAEDVDNEVIVKQNFPQGFNIVKENVKGEKVNISNYSWKIKAPKDSKVTLIYTVDIPDSSRLCL